jgi:hypothetical protein
MPVIMDAERIGRTLTRIAHEIVERNRGLDDLARPSGWGRSPGARFRRARWT